jgi:signal transduction histidine kinase
VEDIANFSLEQQVRLTRSRVGALGFLNAEESVLTLHGWLLCYEDQCRIQGNSAQIVINETGIWADAVRQRKTIMLNGLSRSEAAKACPESPVLLQRCVTIPVFDSGRIVAVALVGNKAEEYDQADVRQFTLLMDGMWKLIRKELAEKALRESESLAAMGRALSSVAHDMKTPLIAIGGFTSMVRRRLKEDDPALEKLDIVINETRRLENMVKDMLDFSRPLVLDRKTEDFRNTVNESVALVEAVAAARDIQVAVRIGTEPIKASYDSMRLKQVLINLLMNAVQATPQGGEVSVVSFVERENLIFEVIDCGCGIPEEKRVEVFSPFVTTKKEGTGLGLAIVKKIVDSHEGKIEILDNPDQGVTVRVTLPVKIALL